MRKILFIPPNSREIAQLVLVKPELDKLGIGVATIAINEKMDRLLVEAGFSFKRFSGYRSHDMLKVMREENPELVVTNHIGAFPLLDAFTMAANKLDIPCLQIFNGVFHDLQSHSKGIPWYKPIAFALLRTLHTLTGRSQLTSLICFLVTLRATRSLRAFLEQFPREFIRLLLPIGRSFRYRENASMIVPGYLARESLMANGWPERSIHVMGQARIDHYVNRRFNSSEVRQRLGIREEFKMLVLTTQPLISLWTAKDHATFVTRIVSAADSFKQTRLIIKIHPEEEKRDYERLLAGLGRRDVMILDNTDIYELINACDLLMTTHSTTALEAMIMDKPVICIDFTGRCLIETYTADGMAIAVRHQSELLPAIQMGLYDATIMQNLRDARHKNLDKLIYKPDGRTSSRIADLMHELITRDIMEIQEKDIE